VGFPQLSDFEIADQPVCVYTGVIAEQTRKEFAGAFEFGVAGSCIYEVKSGQLIQQVFVGPKMADESQ
jgi:hypothetical protein